MHRGADRRDLAHLAEGHVIAVVVDHAQTHRVHAASHGAVDLERVVSETGEGVETCFEHAVELDQLGARNGGLKGLDRLDRGRCATGDDDAKRAQVAPREVGRVQHRDDRRRRRRNVCDALPFDELQRSIGREALHQYDARTCHRRLHEGHVSPVQPHRQVVEHHVPVGDGELPVERLARAQRRVEAVQYPLGVARRARRETHAHHVERRHVEGICRVDLRRVMHDLGETDHIGCVDIVDADGERQLRQARTQLANHREIIEAFELARRNVRFRPRELEDVLDFHRTEISADLVGDRTDQLERKEDDRELDPVRQLQRYDVASLHALAAQELREAPHLRP